jgi:hypothetical protein
MAAKRAEAGDLKSLYPWRKIPTSDLKYGYLRNAGKFKIPQSRS